MLTNDEVFPGTRVYFTGDRVEKSVFSTTSLEYNREYTIRQSVKYNEYLTVIQLCELDDSLTNWYSSSEFSVVPREPELVIEHRKTISDLFEEKVKQLRNGNK